MNCGNLRSRWGRRVATRAQRAAVALGLLGLFAGPARAQLAVTITGPGSLPSGFEGSPYSQTFAASGGTGIYSWAATGLPAGLAMSVTGVLGGIPAAGSHGAYNIKATVTDLGGGANSVTLPLTIVTGQTISFGALPNQPFGTPPFPVSASASSGLPVSFTSTTPAVCTVSGATVTLINPGTCAIQASQPGNAIFTGASPVIQSFQVTIGGQTILFGAIANRPLGTPPFVISASASSGAAVGFASLTPGVCTVSGATVTLVATGTCTIQATQPGNALYTAATPVSQSFQVTLTAQFIAFNALPNQPLGAAPFAVQATASSGLAVSFASLTGSVCTVSGATVTLIATGTCSIDASQSGNAIYAAASDVVQSFQVGSATQTISFGALVNQPFGTLPFLVSAAASSGLPVSFASTTPIVCAVSGATVMLLSAGTCTIQATQAGNATYIPAAPVSQSFQVTQGPQTISFTALPDQPLGASPFTISASASSGLAVSFTSITPAVCTVLGATVTPVSVGTCTIQAMQSGNANYSAASPVNQSFQVTPGSESLSITTLSIPAGLQGVVYPMTALQVRGGTAPFIWSATGLPAGVSLSSGGVLSGTPLQGGTSFQATVTVSDGSAPQSLTASRVYNGTVDGATTLLTASPLQLSFSYTQGDPAQPASQVIGLSSTPAETAVNAAAATSDGSPWLIIRDDFTAGKFPSQTPGNIVVSVNPAGLAPNTYTGQVTITAPGATPSTAIATVTLIVLGATQPPLSASAASKNFALVPGGQSVQGQVLVFNTGGGTLQFTAQASSDGNWLTLTGNNSGSATPSSPATLNFLVSPGPALPSGLHIGQVAITDIGSGAQVVTPITLAISGAEQSMQLSQSGLTFTSVAGSTGPAPQAISVLNLGTGSMAWTTQTQTLPGGQNWLRATPAGNSTPASAGLAVVSVDPSGLAVGQHYGMVQVLAPNAGNNPQAVSVELNVVSAGQWGSAPQVSTAGVILSGVTGEMTQAQPVNLIDPQGRSLGYTTNAYTVDGGGWLSVSPVRGSLSQLGLSSLNIQANLTGITAVRYGTVQVAFSEGTVHTIAIAAIPVAAAATSATGLVAHAAPSCQPNTLVARFQTLEQAQTAQIAVAQPVRVQVADGCGAPVTGPGAAVAVSFSNGDGGLLLADLGGGTWGGTWTPVNAQTQVQVQAHAVRVMTNGGVLAGDAVLTGVAVVPANLDGAAQPLRTLNAATLDPSNTAVVTPGGYVTIFGTRLANGAAQAPGLPLPFELGHTRLLLGNQPLPLLYVSPTQVNGLIPQNLALDTAQQLYVQRDNALSVPLPLTVTDLQPGIFTLSQTGQGQGAILVSGTGLVAGPAGPASRPAHRGEYLELYCTGLGPVQGGAGEAPPGDGQPAPASGNPLYTTVAAATVTIGGVPATVEFAGLAPGSVSLYQVNVRVPDGAPAGDAVPVVLTMTGNHGPVSSPPATVAIQ